MDEEFELFAETPLSQYIGGKQTGFKNKIRYEDEDRILNINKGDYLDYIVEEYSIPELLVNFDNPTLDSTVQNGKVVYKLYFQISGNLKLLTYKPDDFNGWSTTAHLTSESDEFWVRLPIEQDIEGSEEIKTQANLIRDKIHHNYEAVHSQISLFNDSLREEAEKLFDTLKRRYLTDKDILDEIDLEVRTREDRPETFAVDSLERREKIAVEEPELEEGGSIERIPTLSEGAYFDILEAINDIGQGFERYPQQFMEKKEEELRDFLLFFLQMNFVGEATGESFNNTGKTDVLLRHEGDNIFIGECAIWNGKQYLLDKIDQLKGYLTWRDTKAAIILFSKTESMTGVHEQILTGVESHPQFKEFVGQEDESWYQYRLHFPEDEERIIHLAVIVFHLRAPPN